MSHTHLPIATPCVSFFSVACSESERVLLSCSLQRHSTTAVWQAVECGGQRLSDIWKDYQERGGAAAALISRPLPNADSEYRVRGDAPPRTIVVLACKFAKLLSKTKAQLQRLDPDILRLDTLQEQVRVESDSEHAASASQHHHTSPSPPPSLPQTPTRSCVRIGGCTGARNIA